VPSKRMVFFIGCDLLPFLFCLLGGRFRALFK
jgi:hypothetical protein